MTLKRFLWHAVVLLAVALWAAPAAAGDKAAAPAYQLTGIEAVSADKGVSLMIKGNAAPTFTVYELFDPHRVAVDIADAAIGKDVKMPVAVNQGPVAQVTGKVLADDEPQIVKLEVELAGDVTYTVNRAGNDIILLFTPKHKDAAAPAATAAPAPAAADSGVEIHGMEIADRDGSLAIDLRAGRRLEEFRKAQLGPEGKKPARFYIDLPGVTAPALARVTPVGKAGLAQIRVADRADGVRIVFDAAGADLFSYDVAPTDTGLRVTIAAPAPQDEVAAVLENKGAVAAPKAPATPKAEAAPKKEEGHASVTKLHKQLANAGVHADGFADAGYDRQRISVDFYKINLHNVFRLIGEVSGYNMVIDDAVNGSLTLTLNDVPWDFVLDVIVNLKDLQKEERYNTIVISPKSKAFSWPEPKKEELEIKAPSKDVEVDIAKKLDQPPEKLEAKMLLQKGKKLVAEGDLKKGLDFYEQAYAKWPENTALAKRIAGICLVKLGLNQKAVFYAKKVLKTHPDDREAALQAAVGLANMRLGEAATYFKMALQGPTPAREALQSAAAFYEDSGDYPAALATLQRYEDSYGPALETMVARARILDKQGKSQEAAAMYRAILYSGYAIDDDLSRYIKGRVALDNK